jgi:hypothetical protein
MQQSLGKSSFIGVKSTWLLVQRSFYPNLIRSQADGVIKYAQGILWAGEICQGVYNTANVASHWILLKKMFLIDFSQFHLGHEGGTPVRKQYFHTKYIVLENETITMC